MAYYTAGIDCMNGTAHYSSPLFPPRSFGSAVAPLARVIMSGHEGRSDRRTRREWDCIWSKVWLLGCREEQIADAGDFVCTNIGNESVLLVRQTDGGIRAFYNGCRHRGNRLADEGTGQGDFFQCSYHNWQYNLDGSFKNIPDLATFPQGAPPCSGLREIPCDTWASFVWFSLNEDVEPLQNYLGEVAGHMEPYHFERMAMTRWVTRRAWRSCRV